MPKLQVVSRLHVGLAKKLRKRGRVMEVVGKEGKEEGERRRGKGGRERLE